MQSLLRLLGFGLLLMLFLLELLLLSSLLLQVPSKRVTTSEPATGRTMRAVTIVVAVAAADSVVAASTGRSQSRRIGFRLFFRRMSRSVVTTVLPSHGRRRRGRGRSRRQRRREGKPTAVGGRRDGAPMNDHNGWCLPINDRSRSSDTDGWSRHASPPCPVPSKTVTRHRRRGC